MLDCIYSTGQANTARPAELEGPAPVGPQGVRPGSQADGQEPIPPRRDFSQFSFRCENRSEDRALIPLRAPQYVNPVAKCPKKTPTHFGPALQRYSCVMI